MKNFRKISLWDRAYGKKRAHTNRKKLFYVNSQKIKTFLKLGNFWAKTRFSHIGSCGSKISKIFISSKWSKNIIFNICCFLLFFGQSGLSCPLLPNFASQKFLGARGYPVKIWKFQKNLHYLSDLSDRNFCRGSKIFAKIETSKSVLKHISVP